MEVYERLPLPEPLTDPWTDVELHRFAADNSRQEYEEAAKARAAEIAYMASTLACEALQEEGVRTENMGREPWLNVVNMVLYATATGKVIGKPAISMYPYNLQAYNLAVRAVNLVGLPYMMGLPRKAVEIPE